MSVKSYRYFTTSSNMQKQKGIYLLLLHNEAQINNEILAMVTYFHLSWLCINNISKKQTYMYNKYETKIMGKKSSDYKRLHAITKNFHTVNTFIKYNGCCNRIFG